MTQFTRIHDRFSYHAEDVRCEFCLFRETKRGRRKNGAGRGRGRGRETRDSGDIRAGADADACAHACGRELCEFEGIRADAIAGGRLKRKRGWFRCPA
jgi:hypothetical protein